MTATTWVCSLCHFDTETDDIAIRGPHGQIVCLRCYERETGAAIHLSPEYLKAFIDAAENAPNPGA